jgi:hypothetical protein
MVGTWKKYPIGLRKDEAFVAKKKTVCRQAYCASAFASVVEVKKKKISRILSW